MIEALKGLFYAAVMIVVLVGVWWLAGPGTIQFLLGCLVGGFFLSLYYRVRVGVWPLDEKDSGF